MKNVLVIMALALMTGCSSVGNNFNASSIDKIKKGKTTEPELIQLFGQPQSRGMNSAGDEVMTWIYSQANVRGSTFIPIVGAFAGGVNTKSKVLSVQLAGGVVTNYNYSDGGFQSRGTLQDDPDSTNSIVQQPISRK